jgi:hypothetical protein
MLTIPPARDLSLQELLWPPLHLDRQIQLASALVEQLQDLEDELELIAVPLSLTLVTRCIHCLQRAINALKLHKLLILYQLQRALNQSFRQHLRAPLMDLDHR